jgi:hypothetical protein
MHILSFDCAIRSLAVCFISVDPIHEITKTPEEKSVDRKVYDENVKIHILKVFDLTKGEKINTVLRTSLLKECLISIDILIKELKIKPDQVLVEYQMSANDKSRCVSNGILYHYSCIKNLNIELVGPSLKNKICFSLDETLTHGSFMEKYASKYTANKNHSKANFIYWLKLYGLTSIIQENKIEKKNIDDIADAFMQIWGWIYFRKLRKLI